MFNSQVIVNFQGEEVKNEEEMRFFVKSQERKRYLMVERDGSISMVDESDFSSNENSHYTFVTVSG